MLFDRGLGAKVNTLRIQHPAGEHSVWGRDSIWPRTTYTRKLSATGAVVPELGHSRPMALNRALFTIYLFGSRPRRERISVLPDGVEQFAFDNYALDFRFPFSFFKMNNDFSPLVDPSRRPWVTIRLGPFISIHSHSVCGNERAAVSWTAPSVFEPSSKILDYRLS